MNREWLSSELNTCVGAFDINKFHDVEWEKYVFPEPIADGILYPVNMVIATEEIIELVQEIFDVDLEDKAHIGIAEELADVWLFIQFMASIPNVGETLYKECNAHTLVMYPEKVLMNVHQDISKYLRGRISLDCLMVSLCSVPAALRAIECRYNIEHSYVSKIMNIKFEKIKSVR